MRTNFYVSAAIQFMLLLLVQVVVCNQLNIFNFINPMIYILFLYWYPVKQNRAVLLILSFLFGLSIDWFSDTLAMHTSAMLTIAYLRPAIMRFCFGVNFEFQSFKLNNATRIQQLTFFALLIGIHHTVFFTLEAFSFSNTLLILKKIVSTGLATFVLGLVLISLFSTQKK